MDTFDAFSTSLHAMVREVVRAELDAQNGRRSARLLSVNEAADALGISRAQFYKLLAAEKIRSHHIGRRRLIPASALDAYEAELAA